MTAARHNLSKTAESPNDKDFGARDASRGISQKAEDRDLQKENNPLSALGRDALRIPQEPVHETTRRRTERGKRPHAP